VPLCPPQIPRGLTRASAVRCDCRLNQARPRLPNVRLARSLYHALVTKRSVAVSKQIENYVGVEGGKSHLRTSLSLHLFCLRRHEMYACLWFWSHVGYFGPGRQLAPASCDLIGLNRMEPHKLNQDHNLISLTLVYDGFPAEGCIGSSVCLEQGSPNFSISGSHTTSLYTSRSKNSDIKTVYTVFKSGLFLQRSCLKLATKHVVKIFYK
jgi:hypothetical protein